MSSLQQLIHERIQREGPIPFAEYMRTALYEPGYGYYVTGPAKMGWEGDYYTSTDVSNLFAHCMGRQLYQMWERLGQPEPFTVLEQGSGRGDLRRAILTWAEQTTPLFYSVLDYHTQDITQGQDANALLQEPPAILPFVILSNELADAFPVHILEKHGDQLYEVFVTVEDNQLREVLDEPGSAEVAEYLDTYKVPWNAFPDGWRAEINLDAIRWIERCTQLLSTPSSPRRLRYASERTLKRRRQGFLLTIDYGDKARNLYIPERSRGTLACYYRHQLNERPLVQPGEQDITAHVNFSALIETGRRCGLRLDRFTTQRHWLMTMGIYEEMEQLRKRDYAVIDTDRSSDRGQVALLHWYGLRQRVSALTDPAGMGDFKVLILKRPA